MYSLVSKSRDQVLVHLLSAFFNPSKALKWPSIRYKFFAAIYHFNEHTRVSNFIIKKSYRSSQIMGQYRFCKNQNSAEENFGPGSTLWSPNGSNYPTPTVQNLYSPRFSGVFNSHLVPLPLPSGPETREVLLLHGPLLSYIDLFLTREETRGSTSRTFGTKIGSRSETENNF